MLHGPACRWGPRVRGPEPVRGAGGDTASRSWCAKGDKRNLNCWNVFCRHIWQVSCSCFCDKEGVFCICNCMHISICHIACVFLLMRVFPSRKLKQSRPCKIQAAVAPRQDEESIRNHHKLSLRTQSKQLEPLQTGKRKSNFCFNSFKKCIHVMKPITRHLDLCNHISHVCFLLLHVRDRWPSLLYWVSSFYCWLDDSVLIESFYI